MLLTTTLDNTPRMHEDKQNCLRRRPTKLHANKAYNSCHYRAECRTRGIQTCIVRKGVDNSHYLGRHC